MSAVDPSGGLKYSWRGLASCWVKNLDYYAGDQKFSWRGSVSQQLYPTLINLSLSGTDYQAPNTDVSNVYIDLICHGTDYQQNSIDTGNGFLPLALSGYDSSVSADVGYAEIIQYPETSKTGAYKFSWMGLPVSTLRKDAFIPGDFSRSWLGVSSFQLHSTFPILFCVGLDSQVKNIDQASRHYRLWIASQDEELPNTDMSASLELLTAIGVDYSYSTDTGRLAIVKTTAASAACIGI